MEKITIRKIEAKDNEIMASVIRQSLIDFNAAKPGTVYFDPTTDHLFELFKVENSVYFVLEINKIVVGGSGIFPTENLDNDTCELVKLYLHKDYRGKGLGKLLLLKCMQEAKIKGYSKIYLETLPELKSAIPLYEQMGFKYIPKALGNSGHGGCDIFMIKEV